MAIHTYMIFIQLSRPPVTNGNVLLLFFIYFFYRPLFIYIDDDGHLLQIKIIVFNLHRHTVILYL